MRTLRKLNVCLADRKFIVQVAAHRGEELFRFFASQGIKTRVVFKPFSLLAWLEMQQEVNLDAVHAILNQWM